MNQDLENGGQAFPRAGFVHPQYTCTRREAADLSNGGNYGMTLRDYFAAKALQGIISKHGLDQKNWMGFLYAKDAYLIADEMIKARK